MNQSDGGYKRKILIGIACAVLLVAGVIIATSWQGTPKPRFVPHVEPVNVVQEEVDEPKVRELRERPKKSRDDDDTIREPKARKKKENKKIPLPPPVAGLP